MTSILERETTLTREPQRALETEASAIRALDAALAPAPRLSAKAKLISPTGCELELPSSVYKVLRQVVHDLARGKAVTVAPIDTVLTTQPAADLLNVSRPYLIKLLESGEIPFQKIGTHRRIKLQDVLDYRRKRGAARRAILDEMAQDAQDMSLID